MTERDTGVQIRNSSYVDGMYEVLKVVRLKLGLPGVAWWHTADYYEDGAEGGVFSALDEETRKIIATVIIVDVSKDSSEPDTSRLDESEAKAFDRHLEVEAERKLAAMDTKLVKWMSSQLNEASGQKALVTAFTHLQSGEAWQSVQCRLTVDGRRWVLSYSFDVKFASRVAHHLHHIVAEAQFIRADAPN
jgi:hypothetical protein